MPDFSRKLLGKKGEDIASKLLRKNGYKIITRNFRSKFGEIDIIAKDADTLVFVEVKTRYGKKYGLPEEAVNKKKLSKIIKCSQYYNLIEKIPPSKQRIDVVSIIFENNSIFKYKIIKNV